ncbi:MAG TPA: VWA domain-containing protein [Pyrinomonadaceae bacterium]|nr:VWA domain-containing protein [Pyrinomonadaceae bacterium]
MMNKNRIRVWRLLLLSLFALVPSFLAAQEVDPSEVIRVNTDLVVLDAQVIDRKTRKVFGPLRKEDFEILEENVKQEIAYFGQDQLPLSILLLLDVSRSVRPVIEQVGEGANNALRQLKPEDEVAVMAFADYPKLIQPFTKDRTLTANKITVASQAELGDGTFVYEAMLVAVQEINKGTNPANRRAIILISDNIPSTGDEDYVARLQRELAESGTVVYGLTVRGGFAKVFNVLTLGKIKAIDVYAEETGGEVLGANQSEVDSRLGEMFTRLRTRYTIGYRPPETNEEGAFRHVKVQLAPAIMKANKKLVVRSRRGYYFRKKPGTIPPRPQP